MRKLSDLLFACMLVATVASTMFSCGPTSNEQAYLIDQSRADPFLGLIARTASLIGRHSVLPAGIDSTAPTGQCPSDGTKGVVFNIGGCDLDAGTTSCVVQETYGCPLVNGSIVGSVESNAQGMGMLLQLSNYSEGSTALGTTEVHFDGKVAFQTGNNTVTYSEDQTLVAVGVDSKTVINALGSYSIAISPEAIVFSGTVTYDVIGTGIVLATLSDMNFPLSGDCAGHPNSGSIKVEIEGLESGIALFTACDEYTLQNLDPSGNVAKETVVGPEFVAPIYAPGVPDMLRLADVNLNLAIPSAFPYRTDEYALDPTHEVREVFCRPVLASEENLIAEEVTADAEVFFADMEQAECLTFIASVDMGSDLTSPTHVKRVIAARVAFLDKDQPVTDPSNIGLMSVAYGAPVSAESDSEISFVLSAHADTFVYSNQLALETALMLEGNRVSKLYGNYLTGMTDLNTYKSKLVTESVSPFASTTLAPVDTTYEWSRLGLWLMRADEEAGLFLPVH